MPGLAVHDHGERLFVFRQLIMVEIGTGELADITPFTDIDHGAASAVPPDLVRRVILLPHTVGFRMESDLGAVGDRKGRRRLRILIIHFHHHAQGGRQHRCRRFHPGDQFRVRQTLDIRIQERLVSGRLDRDPTPLRFRTVVYDLGDPGVFGKGVRSNFGNGGR